MNQACTTDYPRVMLLQMEIRRLMAQGKPEEEVIDAVNRMTCEEEEDGDRTHP